MQHPIPGPSRARITVLGGTKPGLLDPTQPARLLRYPGSTLSFASFDPKTASPDLNGLQKLSINEELYRPKRVVLETAPTGQISWRFVPSARRDPGVPDEGQWPRMIEICGERVECSQDQWDIYKLDPCYKCYVRAAPDLTVITRIHPTAPQSHAQPPDPSKRRLATSPSPERSTLPPRKKVFSQYPGVTVITDSEESDEEVTEGEGDEVAGMALDDRPSVYLWSKLSRESEQMKQRRKRRRERLKKRNRVKPEPLSQETMVEDEGMQSAPGTHTTMEEDSTSQLESTPRQSEEPNEARVKRKVNALFENLQIDTEVSGEHGTPRPYSAKNGAKRARILSPTSAQRDIEQRRKEYERMKHQRKVKKTVNLRNDRVEGFLHTVFEEAAPFINGQANPQTSPLTEEDDLLSDGVDEEERARQAAIEESKRKLAELEADRPLWEEARKRRLQEEEEERRRLQAKRAEAERQARMKQEQEERAQREREAQVRAERERREREKRQRQQRWALGPWTTQRALERYKVMCEAFDSTKFGPEEPLSSDMVPWPVLQSPSTFAIEDVDWTSVEKFFEAVRSHMRSQDYKVFVEKSHRRFHPDRWRSRSLLKSVIDEAERECMEVAANTVAQALTPIWRSLTGR